MKAIRVLDLEAMSLSAGSHLEGAGEMCVVEGAAYLAGEDWTDRPVSVSGVIRDLLVALNDSMNDVDREALRPLIAVLPGSHGNHRLELARSWMVMDWHCRAWPAVWLRSIGCVDEAGPLESAGEIVDADSLEAALELMRDAHAVATDRRLATMNTFVEKSLATSVAAADAGDRDPALVAARHAIRTGAGWAAISEAQRAVPPKARWRADRTARWSRAWDTAGYRMAVTVGTAQIAVVRALAASSAWDAAWSVARADAGETWDLACREARSVGREAATALASGAAWAATDDVDERLAWGAAAEAAATALGLPARALQQSAIALVAVMIDMDLEAPKWGQPLAWR